MSALLEIENLAIDFSTPGGAVRAVDGVSFSVPHGRTVALVGESGSGKSVTAQAVMGILPRAAAIRSGSIRLRREGRPEVDIAALDPDGRQMRRLRGGAVSIIFQEPMTSLSPLHTIGDQVSEALRLHSETTARQLRTETADMLRLVGFPDPERALDTYPFELSGGLRQRAMIAMALICRPALLIADEPTTALDVTVQAQILKLVKDLQRELGMAVLMITHDLGVVANMAEELVVMYHGRIVEAGSAEDVFRRAGHPYLKALLRAVPRFHMAEGERLTPIREVRPETGGLLAGEGRTEPQAPADRPLLEVRGLTKRYGSRKAGLFGGGAEEGVLAVDDVSFRIERGECLGLVGESGCGKSTLSKIVMRALTPDRGEVLFDDNGAEVDLLRLPQKSLLPYRRRIQYVFQDPFSALNPRMTAFDIVSEPLVVHRLAGPEERRGIVRELMRLVGLDERHLNRYPHSFSGGQRQRLGIARALALKPELLLCDEPVSALDVSVQAQILNLLKDLQKALGLTYLFVSHNLAVVDYMAERIAVMCAGRLVELAPREVLFRNPRHPYTEALLAAVPEPDLDYPLDFRALADERASKPELWPGPYRLADGARGVFEEIEEGHFVRLGEDAAPGGLAA